MRVLTEYCQERKEILKFDSMPARVGSATGYVSATKLNNTLYGSEGKIKIFRSVNLMSIHFKAELRQSKAINL